jgi:hypothetical protein
MPSLLHASTAGDRREIRSLLSRLAPLDRVRFLCACCLEVNRPGLTVSARNMPLDKARVDDAADAWVTRMVYADLLMFANCYGLDLDAAVTRLAGYAARPAGLRENPKVARLLRDALKVRKATG